MKTKEFIKQLKYWDYTVRIDDDFIEVYDSEEIIMFFNVSSKDEYVINTCNNNFMGLPIEDRKILFDLIYEYIRTPVEEREEEKKYYLRHKPKFYDNENEEGDYLNYAIYLGSYFLDTNIGGFNVKTSFTQKEIDEIKERFNTDLSDFEIIEVED